MAILINQLKKLSTFIYILIFIFVANIIFNLNYQWEGVSIIVRVYLYIFSFYLIYNFSSIDLGEIKFDYRNRYGKKGDYILFFIIRFIPICIIYFIIVLFTFIEILAIPDWQMRLIFHLLSGGYSNVIIYSVILLVVLKMQRDPRVTIPLFFIYSMVYFIINYLVYEYFPTGLSITGIKLFKFVSVLFFLIYEFFYEKGKIVKIIVGAIFIGTFMYFSLIAFYSMIYEFSPNGSVGQRRAGVKLMGIGFPFPFEGLKATVLKTTNTSLLKKMIYYSKKYKKNIDYTEIEWEKLMFSDSVKIADIVSNYIINKNVHVSYKGLMEFAEVKSNSSDKLLLKAENFTKYASGYFEKNSDDFLSRFSRNNINFKLWTLKVISRSKCIKSIPFLINMLTDVDPRLSAGAYSALKEITDKDFALELKVHINSPEVVKSFMNYYNSMSR